MIPGATAPGETTGYIDALFTATSAVCVTGLIVVPTATHWSVLGQSIILLLIQVGGLGIMTSSATVALLIGKRITLRERLVMQEAMGQYSIAGLVRLTRYIVAMTFLAEIVGGLLLFFRLRPILVDPAKSAWFSLFHSISAFCNAGFDIFGNSLESFVADWWINLTMMSLIVVGGIGFVVVFEVWNAKARWSKLSLHSKLAIGTTVVLLVVGTLTYLALEYTNPATLAQLEPGSRLLAAMFQSVTPRTAGFNTIPTSELRQPSLLFTMGLMFIGASPGGTGGGVKTTTFIVLLLALQGVLCSKEACVARRRISKQLIDKSMLIFGLAGLLVFFATFALTITETQPFLTLAFEAMSAFGTVGLSMGATSSLTTAGKIVIIIVMFAGRVGPLTVAMAVAQQKQRAKFQYPEEKVVVG